PCARFVAAHRHAVAGGQPEDSSVESAGLVVEDPGEVVGHPHLVETTRYLACAEERLDLRSEEEGLLGLIVVEGLDATMIPRTEERPSTGLPDSRRNNDKKPRR